MKNQTDFLRQLVRRDPSLKGRYAIGVSDHGPAHVLVTGSAEPRKPASPEDVMTESARKMMALYPPRIVTVTQSVADLYRQEGEEGSFAGGGGILR